MGRHTLMINRSRLPKWLREIVYMMTDRSAIYDSIIHEARMSGFTPDSRGIRRDYLREFYLHSIDDEPTEEFDSVAMYRRWNNRTQRVGDIAARIEAERQKYVQDDDESNQAVAY